MAQKVFYVDINLDLNQLKSALVENVIAPTTPSVATKGRFVYNTVASRMQYDDGVAIQSIATLTDIVGGLNFKGGYNVLTNVPDLVTPIAGAVKKGDYYVVTTGGTFFGQTLEIGDSLFARIDDPALLVDWVLIQGNTVNASETVAGVIRIGTQGEVDAGTLDTVAVTPLKLKNASFLAKKYVSGSTAVGSATPVTITHGLGNLSPQVSIKDVATGQIVELAVNNFTLTTCDVTKNGTSANVIVTVVG